MSTGTIHNSICTTEWLSNNINSVKILDGSWHMPNSGRNPYSEYVKKHIKGAKFFDIDKICDLKSSLPHMLPSTAEFSTKIGNLGISETDDIVVYDSVGFGPAARVYWTFKCFGHKNIRILDGGLVKWCIENHETVSGDDIDVKYPATYIAKWNPELVKNYDQIGKSISSNCSQLVDARSKDRFDGSSPEPRAELSSGHMPGAINIPFQEVVDPTSKTLLSKDNLMHLFKEKGVKLDRPIITTCGSGITASILYVALERVGATDISVYDGSWTEYASLPTSKIIKN